MINKNTKNILKTTLSVCLVLSLVVSVLLTATHAKDLVAYSLTKVKVLGSSTSGIIHPARTADEPITKALGDLHHHSDNTVVKHLVKTTSGDAAQQAARRESEVLENEHPLSTVVFNLMMTFRFAMACAMAR